MSLLNSLEQKVLFRFTRGLAIALISVVLLGLLGLGGYMLLNQGPSHSKDVSAKQLVAELKAAKGGLGAAIVTPNKGESGASNLDPLSNLKVPLPVQEILDTDRSSREFFNERLRPMDRGERQAYLNNLGAVLIEAKKESLNVVETVMAFEKARGELAAEASKAEAEAKASRALFQWYALAAFFLIAQFSLVLVLLAIERNTRTAEQK